MEKEILELLTNLLVAVVGSFITVRLTVGYERKKTVGEVRRNAYMKAYRCMAEITKNPIIIFEDSFFYSLEDAKLEIDVYASKNIQKKFLAFWRDVSQKHEQYIDKFKIEDVYDEREAMRNDPFFGDLVDKEEEDFAIANMIGYGKVEQLANDLKNAIAETLRKG